MSSHDVLREFLTTRRARLTPSQVGLPDFGGRRRVPGLRREEVAMLAGMSTEYYVRLERGNARGVSQSILDGLGRALQLDAAEYAHLCDLVRSANEGSAARRRRTLSRRSQVRPAVQQTIDAMTHVPVVIQNGRLEVMATNQLGTALFAPMFDAPQRPANFARYVFLDPDSEDFYRDWHDSAVQLVTVLRGEAGRAPYDRALTDLVGELSTRSEVFRTLWATHDVRNHDTGVKRIHHPVVGDMELNYEALEVHSNQGFQLVAFSAALGTPSHDALQLLASWAASGADGSATAPDRTDAPGESH